MVRRRKSATAAGSGTEQLLLPPRARMQPDILRGDVTATCRGQVASVLGDTAAGVYVAATC
jgi:hypothetical protein